MSHGQRKRPTLITPTTAEYRAVGSFLAGLAADSPPEMIMCGVGPERARALCLRLDEREEPPGALALVGVAGGLDAALAARDAVLASAALYEDGSQAPCTLIPLPGAAVGPMLTVSRALYTPAEKAAARTTGALAVEMEAYPFAAWAAQRGVPFVHARVVLDPVDEVLPDLENALDAYGRVRTRELARLLLAHPAQTAALLRLMRRSQAVAPALGRLAREVGAALLR